MTEGLTRETALRLFETMVRIRGFEMAVVDLFAHGKIPGFLHSSVGQEAVPAGAVAALRPDDWIISTHRGHGHVIAKGGRLDLMMAELFGRRTGYNKGKGGSMHIAAPDLRILGANAIVGAGIAIINGAALTEQYLGTDRVAMAFFGDGASNTGSFHEALNMASVWNLPSIFVCEHNGFAESTPSRIHQKIKDVAVRANAYDIPGVTVDGNDVAAVYEAACDAVKRARAGGGPTLIEAKTYRMRGHYEGDPLNYRPKDEPEQWKQKDAIDRGRALALTLGALPADIAEIEERAQAEIRAAVAFAEVSPSPEPADAYTDLFTPMPQEA